MAELRKLAVIVPCFNEQEILPRFYNEITKVMDQLPNLGCNILFVDDGSTDNTLQLIKELNKNDNEKISPPLAVGS